MVLLTDRSLAHDALELRALGVVVHFRGGDVGVTVGEQRVEEGVGRGDHSEREELVLGGARVEPAQLLEVLVHGRPPRRIGCRSARPAHTRRARIASTLRRSPPRGATYPRVWPSRASASS